MPWRPPHHPRLLLLPTSCLWLEEEELCLHSDQSCIIFQSTTHYTDRCWRGKNNKDHNGKKEEVRRVAYDEERSDFSSDISQWLIPPSVDNQSQNAPSAISSILFVCLPVNQLGNQHRNHNQQRLLYIWIVPFFFSPHRQYLTRFYRWFKFILQKALLITRLVTKCFIEWQRAWIQSKTEQTKDKWLLLLLNWVVTEPLVYFFFLFFGAVDLTGSLRRGPVFESTSTLKSDHLIFSDSLSKTRSLGCDSQQTFEKKMATTRSYVIKTMKRADNLLMKNCEIAKNHRNPSLCF